MAIKTAYPKPSKRTLMSLMVLVLLGWLILMGWVSSLWFFRGFDLALSAVTTLLQKQTQAITKFNGLEVMHFVNSWSGALPTHEVGNKLVVVKNAFNNVTQNFNELTDIAQEFILISQQVWLLIGLITQVMLIKLTILICAIPLFILTTTAGLVDGLNQRAIRTASLGRESSYVFHQLNRQFKRGLLLLLALWLAIPLSITPAFVFVPLSLLLSVVVSMTASRFKKYL